MLNLSADAAAGNDDSLGKPKCSFKVNKTDKK